MISHAPRRHRLVGPPAVAAALMLCSLATAQPAAVSFPAYQADRGTVIRYVTLPGRVRADQQVVIHAKIPGYLKSLRVDRGDTVKAGQVIGELDAPELAAELQSHKAEYAVAERTLARLTGAQKEAPDLVVEQAVDDAKGRMEVAKAHMTRVSSLLRYARVVAPFAGIVTERFVDPGAFIPAATGGSTAKSAAIVTVMNLKTVRIQIAIPEIDSVHVARDQPVSLKTDTLPGRTFDGKVSRISYALDTKTQSMLVEADAANPGMDLRPGMLVTARVGVQKHADVVRVPVDALLLEKAGSSVFVHAGGIARKTAVKTGFNDGAFVEVVEGLAAAQTVIRFGKAIIADGQAITVSP